MSDTSETRLPYPVLPTSHITDALIQSLFHGAPMGPEIAEAALGLADQWVSKVDLLRRVLVAREIEGYARVLKGLERVEDAMLSEQSVDNCKVSVDALVAVHGCAINSLKMRMAHEKIVREQEESKTSQASSSEVNQHLHLHLGATSGVTVPDKLVEDEKERRVLHMVHDVLQAKTREVAGTRRIGPPIPRAPRVFTPPPELINDAPEPLTQEEIDELDGRS